MYKVSFRVKIRIDNPANKSGCSWLKRPRIELEANTLEELSEKAFKLPPPDDIDVSAIHYKGSVALSVPKGSGTRSRRDIDFDILREF